MNKQIILTIIFISIGTSTLYAKEEHPALKNSSIASKKNNPFEPKLPRTVKMLEKNKIIETTKTTETTSVQSEASLQPPALDINGLVWNTNRPQAIINNQVVDVGDTIAETKIVAIRKTGVDVSFRGKILTISPSKEQGNAQ